MTRVVHPACDSLRLLNALNREDRGLKVRFSLATMAFDRESTKISQILSSQGKNAPSNPYPHYLVRLATSRFILAMNSPRKLGVIQERQTTTKMRVQEVSQTISHGSFARL